MRKINIVFAVLLFVNAFSQNHGNYCGFDSEMAKIDARFPELKKRRAEGEAKLRKIMIYLNVPIYFL